MTSTPSVAPQRAFWLYLGTVHALYAAFFLAGGGALSPTVWPLQISLPGFVTVMDVVAAPALIYAWTSRQRPLVAILGASLIALAGLVVARAWMDAAEFRAMLEAIPSFSSVAIGFASALIVACELRVLLAVAGFRRSTNFDCVIADLTNTRPGDSTMRRLFNRLHAVELRFWAYGLFRKRPELAEFEGKYHFSYAAQSGNADGWIAWAILNAAPTPLIHFLLHQSSPVAATLTSIMTALGSVWCVAEARAARSRPVSLDEQSLYIRYGLLVDRIIPRSKIRTTRMLDWKDLDVRGVTRYAGCGGANVRLELEGDEVIHIGLDDPHAFISAASN